MKFKKFAAAMLAGLAIATSATLTSCGGDPFEDQSEVSGKYNVEVGYVDSDGGKVVLDALKKDYEAKHDDVNIILKSLGSGFDAYMNQKWNNKEDLPDVIWMPDNEFSGWAAGGNFVDLRSYYESSADTSYDKYYESMLNCASYSGEFKPLSESSDAKYGIYFAPRDYNKVVIAVNKSLFESYDVAIPDTSNGWTMSDFFALCAEINAKITARVNAGGAGAMEASYNRAVFFQLSMEAVYTTMFDSMGSNGIASADGNVLLDSLENAAILSAYYDNITAPDYVLSKSASSFQQGQTFMRCIVRPTAVDLKPYLKDNMDFIAFPAKKADGTSAIGTGCSGYGICAAHAEDEQTVNGVTKKMKDLAWDFIKYVISEDGQEVAGETGLSVPVLKSLAADGKWRTALGNGVNHDAFLSGDELSLNTFTVFDAKLRSSLRPFITSFFDNMSNPTNGKVGNRETYLTACKTQFKAMYDRFTKN